jgi:hypothetical protein
MASCPDCYKGEILLAEPKGTILPDSSYFSPALNSTVPHVHSQLRFRLDTVFQAENSKKAVIILPDIFGLGINNPKILADEFAEKLGVDVYVPDMFAGSHISGESVS